MQQATWKNALATLAFTVLLTGVSCGRTTPLEQSNNQSTDTGKDTSVSITVTKGFSIYTNKMHGFTMQYPENWSLQEGQYGTLVSFSSPQEKNDTFLENINVVTEELPANYKNLSLEDYVSTSLESLKKSLNDFKLVETKSIQLSGQTGKQVTYTVTQGELKPYTRQFVTLKNGVAYIVTYITTQSDPTKYLDVATQVVNSFKLTN